MMFYVILYLIIVLFLLKNKKNAFKKKDQNINVIGYEDFNFKGNAMDLYKDNKYLLLDSNIGDLSFKSFKIRKKAIVEYIQVFNIGGVEGEHKIIIYNKNKTRVIKNIRKYLNKRLNMNSMAEYKLYINVVA